MLTTPESPPEPLSWLKPGGSSRDHRPLCTALVTEATASAPSGPTSTTAADAEPSGGGSGCAGRVPGGGVASATSAARSRAAPGCARRGDRQDDGPREG